MRLAEILVSTGTPAPSATEMGAVQPVDPQKLAAAQAKADDIEAKLHAGGDFSQLAQAASATAPRPPRAATWASSAAAALAKVLEEKTFALKAGQYTEPIRTKQGFVILKVLQHTPGGVPPFKDVEQQVEQAYLHEQDGTGHARLPDQDARGRLHRDQARLYRHRRQPQARRKFPIAYSAYTPPAPKKKKKVERTRFRETARTFRQKSPQAEQAECAAASRRKLNRNTSPRPKQASMKPGKKEKIRFGKAPHQDPAQGGFKPDRGRRRGAAGNCKRCAGAGEPALSLPLRRKRRPASATAPGSPRSTRQRARRRTHWLRSRLTPPR